jgi:NADH dehydrogenase FAD-containing subunit
MAARVLILGAGYAGQLAAARLAKRSDADITVVDASDRFTERIRLHEIAGGRRLRRIPAARLLPRRAVFRQARVLGLHPDARTVAIEDGRGLDQLAYDYLVIALGSQVDRDSVPGASQHTHALTSTRAAREIAARVERADACRVAVVGGGLTGIEAAAELAEAHPAARVTLLSAAPPGDDLSDAGRANLYRAFDRLRVSVRSGVSVERVEHGWLLLSDETAFPFDVCVWAAGFVASDLIRAAGLPLGRAGRAVVLPTLQVPGHPEIFVAGDAAEVVQPGAGPLRMGCVTAEPLGVHAGDQVARAIRGLPARPFEFGFVIRCISLGRRNGLVQFVDAFDRPQPRILKGWLAALIKELICRYTVWVIRAERALPFPVYVTSKPPKNRAPAAAQTA